jgi:Putative inner membrane protein (DUF1819)
MGTKHDINSRLQKGGALLSDMRRLVVVWPEDGNVEDPSAYVLRALKKQSLSRAHDTFIRAFRPRFLEGEPPFSWKLARLLEDAGVSADAIKAFYYWISARNERILYDFTVQELIEVRRSGIQRVRIEEVISWIKGYLQANGKKWSPTVTQKVARGMLAALRDFGILQGDIVKTIAPRHCPSEAFALVAFCLSELGIVGRALIQHPDWRLFLFDENDVERAMLEIHQKGWVNYQVAGTVSRIDFPEVTFKEYISVIIGRKS